MTVIFWTIGATVAVSLISLIGVVFLSFKHKTLQTGLLCLVGLSAGTFIGDAFFHLIPEALEVSSELIFVYVLIGFVLFFIIEKFLYWHHCHDDECDVHAFSYMILVGDAVHNFIDGLIIAASFVVDIRLGLITTLAIIIHEIPQEIGDFAVLLHGGFSKLKAILFNFFSALTAIIGAIVGLILTNYVSDFINIFLPFAAGAFIYIAAADLIPELHKEHKTKKALASFGFFLLGLLIMYGLKVVFEG